MEKIIEVKKVVEVPVLIMMEPEIDNKSEVVEVISYLGEESFEPTLAQQNINSNYLEVPL